MRLLPFGRDRVRRAAQRGVREGQGGALRAQELRSVASSREGVRGPSRSAGAAGPGAPVRRGRAAPELVDVAAGVAPRRSRGGVAPHQGSWKLCLREKEHFGGEGPVREEEATGAAPHVAVSTAQPRPGPPSRTRPKLWGRARSSPEGTPWKSAPSAQPPAPNLWASGGRPATGQRLAPLRSKLRACVL